jgi:hypothetical protein
MEEFIISATNINDVSEEVRSDPFYQKAYVLLENGMKTDDEYARPRGVLSTALSRGLGPLPEGFKVIHDVSAQWAFMRRWQRVVGSISAVVIWIIMAILMTNIPWMVMSPFSIVANLFAGKSVTDSSPVVAVITLVIIAIALVASLIWGTRFRNSLVKMALIEEMWFRAGAEKWSIGKRVYSCVVFSFAHILNLVYPIGVLLVLVIAGAIFMAVYLWFIDGRTTPIRLFLHRHASTRHTT